MCGLVGFVGTLEYKHKKAMNDLFFLDTLRGEDSTGLSVVKRDRTVLTRKMTVPGYEFIRYPIVDRAMSHGDQVWIGHNRFRTTGDVSKANAHPFEVLDDEGDVLLVGAHNGTLNNKFDLDRLLNEKFETDSEALFNLMVEADDFKKAISVARGAWSLVWWDPTTDSVQLLRNKERPMCYAYTKDRKAFVFASEAWMIINACRRNDVELEKNSNGMSCYATLPDHLYTMVIPQEKGTELPDLVREGGYLGGVANFQKGWNRWQSWWDEDPNNDDEIWKQEGEKKAAEAKKETEADGEKKVITLGHPPLDPLGRKYDGHSPLRGHNGKSITVPELNKLKAKGCGWCGDKFEKDSAFAFLDEDNCVCFNCMRDRHPKGDCLRRENGDEEFLDDDLPFEFSNQKDSPEYRTLIEAAVAGSKTAGK